MSNPIYLAAPFFTPEQIARIEKVEAILDAAGVPYFSPRKHLLCPPDADASTRTKAFRGNIDGIKVAPWMLAILDSPDTGTHWEMGSAFGLSESDRHFIPVVGFYESETKQINLMLAESMHGIVRGFGELEKFLAPCREGRTRPDWNIALDWKGQIQ